MLKLYPPWVRSWLAFVVLLPPALGLINMSVTDQSPLITYSNPTAATYNIGLANTTWVVQYSGTQISAYDPDQLKAGSGTSSHYTEQNAASLSIQFSGDSIYAMGSLTGLGGEDYNDTVGGYGDSWIEVNGQQYQGDDGNGLLGYATGLGLGWHTATLSYKGSGRLTFNGFTLTLDLGGDMAFKSVNVAGTNGPESINQAFSLSANDWSLGQVATSPNNYSELLTTHPYASLSYEIPINTSAIVLWGNVSPVDGNYSVTLSSPSVNDVQQTASPLTPPANQSFTQPVDSMSPWQGINVVQYMRVINPNVSHTIKVDKLSDSGYAYGLNGITLISASNTTVPNDPGDDSGGGGGGDDTGNSSGSSVHGGAIAGIVVGVVAGVAIILFLVWFFIRRRKRKAIAVKPADVSAFEVDQNGYADRDRTLRPDAFPVDAEAAYSQAAGGTDDSTLETMTEKQAALLAEHTPNGTASPQMTTSNATPVTIPTTLTSHSSPGQSSPLRLANPSHDASQSNTVMSTASPSDEPKPPGSSTPTASTARRRRRPAERELVQEVDAGRVEPDVERLPPSYDPTWSRRQGDDGTESS